jgi:hypothetical protein
MTMSQLSYGNDPNLNRMIEETVAILNDVDQRLAALKIGIAQAVPHLAPAILARETNPIVAQRLATTLSPYAQPFGQVPPFGQISPFGSQLPPFVPQPFGQASPFANVPTPFGSPFGVPTLSPFATGFGSPVGQIPPFSGVSPFGVPGSFRLY